ncbi:hypothetical protein Gotur_008137 [Gossypium turneri]
MATSLPMPLSSFFLTFKNSTLPTMILIFPKFHPSSVGLQAYSTSTFPIQGFAGEVPSQVSHLSKLVSLDLSGWAYEQLTIDKHALEGLVHNLTEVRHLFLDGMDKSSVNAHVFMNLSSSLRSLSLAHCNLQGKFPKSIFDLPNLNLLNLGVNQLSGQIPRSLGNLLQFTHLDFSQNQLSGKIPRSLGNLL